MDNRPIEQSAVPYHYTLSHTVRPEPFLTIHDGTNIANSV